MRPVLAAIARAAVCRLRRHFYIAWAVLYILAWAAWFQSFCISPPGLGSRPHPILRDTVSSGPRLGKEQWSRISCVSPPLAPP